MQRGLWFIGMIMVTAALVHLYGDAVNRQYTSRAFEAPFLEINQADFGELMTVPGLSEGMAARIVQERQRNGPFLDGDDLGRRVAGIGEKTLDQILQYATISG